MNEKLIGGFASALNMDASELTAALKDGDKWLGEDEMVEVIRQKVGDQVKAAKDDQRKRGQREVWLTVEKKLKSQGFENPDKAQGSALLDSYFEQLQPIENEGEGKKPSEMTEQEIMRHPVFKNIKARIEADAKKGLEAQLTEIEQRALKAETTQKRLVVNAEMARLSREARLNLGESPETQAARLGLLDAKIPYDRISVDGEKVILSDAEGYESDFKSFFLGLATPVFGIVKQNPSRSGANPQAGGAAGAGAGEYKPKYTFAGGVKEYNDLKTTLVDPQERLQVEKDWRHIQQQAAGN